MAFDPIEYLKKGIVDFIFELNSYDIDHIIKRVREDKERDLIIDGFLPKLHNRNEYFCFQIIYDNDKYGKYTKEYLEEGINITGNQIINILKKTSWGEECIFNNKDRYISIFNENTLIELFDYFFSNYEKHLQFIMYFKLHSNLHIRFLFMNYIVTNHPELINVIYDNILKYLTSYTHQVNEQMTFLPEMMKSEDISKLAYSIFKSKLRKDYYYQIKEYILKNYSRNDLGMELLSLRSNEDRLLTRDSDSVQEFISDADRLFISSDTFKYIIYDNFANSLSKEVVTSFENFLNQFRSNDKNILRHIYIYRLGDLLKEYIEKYMSLSKDTTYEYIKSGSTSCVYRFGDYAVKLFKRKWSYEETICPDLYLIIKNLEECYIRDSIDCIVAGIEVQPFLKRSATDLDKSVFDEWKKELYRLGYITLDSLILGNCGDNCMMLDSYKDANTPNPELLPEWFKKNPVVLVDRDLIYKKELKKIKLNTIIGY